MSKNLEEQINDKKKELEELEQKAQKEAEDNWEKARRLYVKLHERSLAFATSVIDGKPNNYPGLEEALEKVIIKEVPKQSQNTYTFRNRLGNYARFCFYFKAFDPQVSTYSSSGRSRLIMRISDVSALLVNDARFEELEKAIVGDNFVIECQTYDGDKFLPVFFFFYEEIGNMSYEEAIKKTGNFFYGEGIILDIELRLYGMLQKHKKT